MERERKEREREKWRERKGRERDGEESVCATCTITYRSWRTYQSDRRLSFEDGPRPFCGRE